MKILKLVILIIIAIFIIALIIGIILPNPRISYNTFSVETSIENVWNKVTNYRDQASWRNGLQKIEVSPDNKGEWREIPITGMPITFKETEIIKNEKYRIDIVPTSGFKGYSVIEFKSNGGITDLEFTEVSSISNPFQRILSYLFYKPESTMKKYEDELKAAF